MAHGWKTRGNSLLVGVLLGLGVGALLLAAGLGVRHWRASRSSENPGAPLLGGSGGPKPAVPPAGEPRPPTPAPPVGATTSAAPATAAGPALTPLPRPGWVEALYCEPTRRPRLAVMTPLSLDLEAELIAYYRSLPSITNKLGLAGVLAHAGGEASVELLIHSLTREYGGRRLTSWEAVQLCILARLLGLAAAHSDRAYEFLVQGVNPGFWTTNITWTAENPGISERLPGECIMGLGLSGREDAWQVILHLKNQPVTRYLKRVATDICDAAFSRAMMAEMGREAFIDKLWFTEASICRIQEWSETPEGREWKNWLAQIRGVPLPP
jgi:hypothetical protein